MILVPITYKGGVYRHNEIIDLIEDLGGYIVQKHMIAQEVVLQCFVPKDDVELIRAIGKPLAGEVIDSPLVGTEIAVVSMSLEIHHLPHPSCDIAEYVRRLGAKSNMVSLARVRENGSQESTMRSAMLSTSMTLPSTCLGISRPVSSIKCHCSSGG